MATTKKKPTVVNAEKLVAERPHHPGRSRDNRVFAGPRLPPNFQTVIDPNKHPSQPWQDLPQATGAAPYRLGLDGILSDEAITRIVQSGRMVFHAVGDTGGVNTPTPQEQVTSFMEEDFGANEAAQRPSFFYHLGDVVYYDGEKPNYYPEFYEPYETYPAPIFAIPGNHDGDVNPDVGGASLEGFVNNFCSNRPVKTPEARDAYRDAMTQPNVYWTLETPLATIVGLYSNCPEGGVIKEPQIQWFTSELRAAPQNKALIVAVHHPLYSAYGRHPGNAHMQTIFDDACKAVGRTPDLVLSGHVHNYQRFTGTIDGKNVPCIVAGAGGYNRSLHHLAKIFHNSSLPISMEGSAGVLENFNDTNHGYLRIEVTKKAIQCDYYAVPDPPSDAKKLKPFDSVRITI